MYLVNDGSFEIKEESVPKFLELLVSQKLIEKEENADVTEFNIIKDNSPASIGSGMNP